MLPIHFPPDLPVSARRAEIEAALAAHPAVMEYVKQDSDEVESLDDAVAVLEDRHAKAAEKAAS